MELPAEGWMEEVGKAEMIDEIIGSNAGREAAELNADDAPTETEGPKEADAPREDEDL